MRNGLAIGLLAVGLALGGIPGCASGRATPAPPEKVTMALMAWPASAPIYVAADKGFFKDEGLEVTIEPVASGHLGLEAVFAGKADLTAATEYPIALAVIQGRPVAIVATIAEVDQASRIIARKDRGIFMPADLRGKRVGLTPGTAGEFFFYTYLTASFMDPGAVQVVDIAADRIVDALLTGEVDAVSTWAPHSLVLRDRLGDGAAVFSDPGLYMSLWNIATTPDLAKRNPERMKGFVRAILRANEFIEKEHDDAYAIAARYLGAEASLYDKEWDDFRFTAELTQGLVLTMEDEARWAIGRRVGPMRETPDFTGSLYVDALKAVRPEAVTVPGE